MGQPGGKKVRKSGIELLRIILMLQVIFLHVCTKGKYSSFARGHLGEWHELFYWCVWLMCRCPVYLYMLISGYFSVTSNKTWGDIKRKVLVSHRSMLFYSIGLPQYRRPTHTHAHSGNRFGCRQNQGLYRR